MTPDRGLRDAATSALLITVLLYPGGWWPPLVIASAVAALMLLRTDVEQALVAWRLILALLIVGFVRSWWDTDNHHIVVIAAVLVWCTTSAGLDRERRSEGARFVIGVVFMAAVLAKVATGDFLDGTFARVWPAYEDRLADLPNRLGVLSEAQVDANIELVEGLSTSADPDLDLRQFWRAPGWFAGLFTLWTLAIELIVASCYLFGRSMRVRQIGHGALLVFCATTYTIVPVQGFAAVLLTLAIAAAGSDRWEKLLSVAFACVIILPISAHLI